VSGRGRAAALVAPRRFEVHDVRIAAPGPGEVRIVVAGSGVCGSNVPLWEGRPWFEYPRPPGAPGHEAWGRVDAVGEDVLDVRVDDAVAFLCDHAFSDRVVIPAEAAVVLPPALRDRPFPGEALGCGFNVAARSGWTAGSTVAVVGTGFLGTVVVALAAAAGADVIAISRRPAALDVASAMGAGTTVALDGATAAAVAAVVADRTDGRGCEVVVEAGGVQETLDLAGSLVAVRGRLVLAGFHQDGPRQVDLQSWGWRGIDVVNAHERDPVVVLDGVRAAAAAVADGWFDPEPLYTHVLPLDRLDDAMALLVDRPDGFMKALVAP
jgi:NADPH:quinone reductase